MLDNAMHVAQVPAFTKLRRQGQLSMRNKIKYEYRMMTTAFSGHLPILTADPVQPQVCLSVTGACFLTAPNWTQQSLQCKAAQHA